MRTGDEFKSEEVNFSLGMRSFEGVAFLTSALEAAT
jgi:hypothetical protein